MAELGDGSGMQEEESGSKPDVKANGRSSFDAGRRSTTPGMELEGEKERALAQAALSVAEIGELYAHTVAGACMTELGRLAAGDLLEVPPPDTDDELSPPQISLRDIHTISTHIPFVETSRAKIAADMENMILNGLAETVWEFSLLRHHKASADGVHFGENRIKPCSPLHCKRHIIFVSFRR